MAEIKWTSEAVRWLQDIYDYISGDSHEAAQRVVKGIYEKTQILKEFPKIGYRYRLETDGEIRILLYGHYRITYLIKETGDIFILGVFHGALEIDRYLQ